MDNKMKTLVAKSVVNNQFWLVTDGEKKVGNVIANGTGFDVRMDGANTFYKNTGDIKRKTLIEFESKKISKAKLELPFAQYPTTAKVYNSILDIKRRLHLYTKTPNSKCYHAAGWFVLNQNGEDEVMLCPKYIFIQRYQYSGPYKTQDEAKHAINSA